MLREWTKSALKRFSYPGWVDLPKTQRHYGHFFHYDSLFGHSDLTFDRIANLGTNAASALDLGGGTARLASRLAQMGVSTVMVDSCLRMLSQAGRRKRKLSKAAQSHLSLLHQPMQSLELGKRFDRVFIVNNGLEHLSCVTEIEQTLLRIHRHLHSDGQLFVEVHHLSYWQSLEDWKNGQWIYHGLVAHTPLPVFLWSRTLPGQSPAQTVWQHSLFQPLQKQKILHTALVHLTPSQWLSLFEKNHFTVNAIWADWNQSPSHRDKPKLIFSLCSRPQRTATRFFVH